MNIYFRNFDFIFIFPICAELFINFLISSSKRFFFFKTNTIIDSTICMGLLGHFLQTDNNNYLMHYKFSICVRCLKVGFYLYSLVEEKIRNEVNRQIALIGVTVFMLIIFIATLLELFENQNRRKKIQLFLNLCDHEDVKISSVDMCLRGVARELTFHKLIYFVIVTLSTVGYGDIVPHSIIGHFLSICLFVFAIILIPKQTNELIGLMDMQKVYQRAKYKSSKKTEHLVLTGFLNTLDLKNFFKELYHQDHGKKEIISVILEKRNMSQDMSSLLNTLDQASFIKYLQGTIHIYLLG